MVCTSDFDSESKCSIHFRPTFLTLLIFTVRENSKYIGPWCNGSTRDFDSLSISSNLVGPTLP